MISKIFFNIILILKIFGSHYSYHFLSYNREIKIKLNKNCICRIRIIFFDLNSRWASLIFFPDLILYSFFLIISIYFSISFYLAIKFVRAPPFVTRAFVPTKIIQLPARRSAVLINWFACAGLYISAVTIIIRWDRYYARAITHAHREPRNHFKYTTRSINVCTMYKTRPRAFIKL